MKTRDQIVLTQTCVLVVIALITSPVSGQITTSGQVTPTYDDSDPWLVPTIDVGFNGTGSIEVAGGSQIVTTLNSINHQFRLGGHSGSTGTLTVSDEGSQVAATGLLTIGSSGNGQVVIENGGLVTSPLEARIGDGAGSSGSVTIQGSGSIFQQTSQDVFSDRLKVGVWGTGTINVFNGGLLRTGRVGMGDSNFALQSTGAGTINVSGVGSKWDLAGPLNLGLVGGEGTVTVTDGAMVESGGVIRVAGGGSSTGKISVNGVGSKWVGGSTWVIGRAVGGGDALVRVENGGRIEAGGTSVSAGAGRTGELIITGMQSQHVGTSLSVAGTGSTTASFSNGGRAETQFASIADFAGSNGTINVDGEGTRFDISRTFSVGGSSTAAGGSGTINITGGDVTVGEKLIIWGGGEVNLYDGSLTVGSLDSSADGATFNLHGGAFKSNSIVGNLAFADGSLAVDMIDGNLIQDGGVLAPGDSPGITTVTGDYLLNQGSIQFELAGLVPEIEFDRLVIQGDAVLSGIIDLDLIDGFNPQLNDSFQLVSASSISGSWTLDVSDAPLSSGLKWNTGKFASAGILSVAAVPEPSCITFLSLAGALTMVRRRGRRG